MCQTQLMDNKNFLPEPPSARQGQPVKVAALGFSGMELERIEKLFPLRRGSRVYHMARPSAAKTADVLLVNYDNPAALRDKQAILAGNPAMPIIAAGHGPLPESSAHPVRGLLIATKLLGALEQVALGAAPSPAAEGLAQAATKPKPSPQAARQANEYRALVVDDSLSIRQSIGMNLAALEVSAVDFADGGLAALEKAQTAQYDIIFLDVMMPDLDGYETCARLRKMPQYKKTPIIMVSGKTSPLDEVKGIIAGCSTYLAKPVKPDEFRKLGHRVMGWLENYRPAAKPG